MSNKTELLEKTDYLCNTCGGTEDMSIHDIKAHLLEEHNIDINKIMCNKKMISHMDGRDWYSSVYEYEFKSDPPVTVTVSQWNKRDKNDIMTWQDGE